MSDTTCPPRVKPTFENNPGKYDSGQVFSCVQIPPIKKCIIDIFSCCVICLFILSMCAE